LNGDIIKKKLSDRIRREFIASLFQPYLKPQIQTDSKFRNQILHKTDSKLVEKEPKSSFRTLLIFAINQRSTDLFIGDIRKLSTKNEHQSAPDYGGYPDFREIYPQILSILGENPIFFRKAHFEGQYDLSFGLQPTGKPFFNSIDGYG